METMYLAGTIAVLFVLLRFVENKYLIKKNVPVKSYLREAVVVCLSVIGGSFLYEQINPVDSTLTSPSVFTGQPEF